LGPAFSVLATVRIPQTSAPLLLQQAAPFE
jgi:hypothetical protein